MEPYKPLFHIVLIEPEIPNNTGNIGRTCVGMQAKLHLVGELGFDISDKQLKRSGLDYWPNLVWQQHASIEDWQKQVSDPKRVFYFTTKTQQSLCDVEFQEGDSFVFGKETKGLDIALLEKNWDQCIKIPQPGQIRSYNLANAVSVALFEGYRQLQSRKA